MISHIQKIQVQVFLENFDILGKNWIADCKFADFEAHKGNFSIEGAGLDHELIICTTINNAANLMLFIMTQFCIDLMLRMLKCKIMGKNTQLLNAKHPILFIQQNLLVEAQKRNLFG